MQVWCKNSSLNCVSFRDFAHWKVLKMLGQLNVESWLHSYLLNDRGGKLLQTRIIDWYRPNNPAQGAETLLIHVV